MRGKSVENIRFAFRIRCEMVQEVRGNYKDKYRRKGGEAAVLRPECPAQEMETQSHCIVCPRWEDIRSGLELTCIDDMGVFLKKLLMERMKENLAHREPHKSPLIDADLIDSIYYIASMC